MLPGENAGKTRGLLEDTNRFITPRITNVGPENDGLVQMSFIFQGWILRFQPLIFQGVPVTVELGRYLISIPLNIVIKHQNLKPLHYVQVYGSLKCLSHFDRWLAQARDIH